MQNPSGAISGLEGGSGQKSEASGQTVNNSFQAKLGAIRAARVQQDAQFEVQQEASSEQQSQMDKQQREQARINYQRALIGQTQGKNLKDSLPKDELNQAAVFGLLQEAVGNAQDSIINRAGDGANQALEIASQALGLLGEYIF